MPDSGCFEGTVLIPAAGNSSRMAGHNKLTLPFGRSTVLGTVVSSFSNAGCLDFVIVSNSESLAIPNIPDGIRINWLTNKDGGTGIGSSLSIGLSVIPQNDPILVCLADLPLLRPETIGKVFRLLHSSGNDSVVRPICNGIPGHPVGFSPGARKLLEQVKSDTGAKRLLDEYKNVRWLKVRDEGIFRDIDTMETYSSLRSLSKK